MRNGPRRVAVVVSHPIQYYVPLYRRLAQRADLELKVFFTWHSGEKPQRDPGFQREVAWDIPLTDGYDFELVPNIARRPGSHHFLGMRNPTLVKRVSIWKPDVVHVTGYAYFSHLLAIRAFSKRSIPVMFRGDSHLLDQIPGPAWCIKKAVLRRVYSWTAACLYVGIRNREYYERIGVPSEKLFYCPHSIEVSRFAEPNDRLEQEAMEWRRELSISKQSKVLLYAGKFDIPKVSVELMQAFMDFDDSEAVLVMVGDGPCMASMREVALIAPRRFRLLSFQNQSRMPIVYRLADVVALPSRNETWGLALNEAMACRRRILPSDKVGAAADLVQSPEDGRIFTHDDWNDFRSKLKELFDSSTNPHHLLNRAAEFDISATENALCAALQQVGSINSRTN